ncbi:SRPBCC domain-containing protein [Solitalea sp. MAHUQ-68]|uniref:SRPBCC domain-containing protein n=1 Tax=Solitalea agri TaxID=2953739 RepID=A0A9X2FDE1_9SPHI|nr:SRPBCC domain-containing protein [Solitalea agri]MCO4294778.1 SRPBCC domain-containing protein [Solitalea agri]
MHIVSYKTEIQASKEKVWSVLWDDASYRYWSSVFHPENHIVSDWEVGSKILFVDNKGNGAFATIAEKVPNEFISFKHLGWIGAWKELPLDFEVTINGKLMRFTEVTENYLLKGVSGVTTLTVEMVSAESDWEDYGNEVYPKALQRIKELAE